MTALKKREKPNSCSAVSVVCSSYFIVHNKLIQKYSKIAWKWDTCQFCTIFSIFHNWAISSIQFTFTRFSSFKGEKTRWGKIPYSLNVSWANLLQRKYHRHRAFSFIIDAPFPKAYINWMNEFILSRLFFLFLQRS